MIQVSKIKNKLLSLILVLVMLIGMIPVSGITASAATAASTTPQKITASNYKLYGLSADNYSQYKGYYGIRSAAELYGFAAMINSASQVADNEKNAVLLQDIVLNSGTVTSAGSSTGTTYDWTPMGTKDRPFLGIFDGNGHTISGIYVSSSNDNVGLFGAVGYIGGTKSPCVKNLVISNSYICGKQGVGGIVGRMSGNTSSVDKCKIEENVTIEATDSYVGGIVGNFGVGYVTGSAQCKVDNCVVLGNIISANDRGNYIGAIVGIYRTDTNAWNDILVGSQGVCYYKKDIVKSNGTVYNFGKGGSSSTKSNSECTQLESASSSHTCLSVEHKVENATCKYNGCTAYSFCLICGNITSGTKTVTYAGESYHVLNAEINCTSGATCLLCNRTFGADLTNHKSSEYTYTYLNSTQHKKAHSCCGTDAGTEAHTYTSSAKIACTYCGVFSVTPTVVTDQNRESLGLAANYVGYYAISSVQELDWFSKLVNGKLTDTAQNQSANAVLLNTIDMSGVTSYTPIGGTTGIYSSSEGTDMGYKGTFDGNGYVIKNLSITGSNDKELTYGVFGTLSGTVKKLGVEGFKFTVGSKDCRVGGIAGQVLGNGLIKDCYVANSEEINATGKTAGGIAGSNYGGTIENCYTYKISITATRYGGITGDNHGNINDDDRKGTVKNCYTNLGSITSAFEGIVENSEHYVSETKFGSGEITYKLNSGVTDGTQVWYQTLNGTNIDKYPCFKGKTVYASGTTYLNAIAVTIKGVTALNGEYDHSTHKGYTGAPTNDEGYTGEYKFHYIGRNDTVYDSNTAPTKAGEYSVIISTDDSVVGYIGSITIDFTVSKKTVGINWGNTEFVYDGTEKKPTAEATATIYGDEIALVVEGEKINANTTDEPEYTATVTGLSGADKDNYQLPTDINQTTKKFTIAKAEQTKPLVNGVNETVNNKKDGEITGVNNTMEYRKDTETVYTEINSTEITGLAAGRYYVRVKGDRNHNPSLDTTVNIAAGNNLTVSLPTTQTGYTLTVDKSELAWNDSVELTFTLKEGYSQLGTFEVKLNGVTPVTFDSNGKCTVANVKENITVTVNGVADITAPDAEIVLGTNKWHEFFNSITFGLFFKDTKEVTITATDKGSGVDKIYYYLSTTALSKTDAEELNDSDWTEYTGKFYLNPQDEYFIYAKATDKDNNKKYISSDKGIVIDNIAPVVSGIANGETHYGDTTFTVTEKHIDKVKVDGNPVTLTTTGKYTITADGREHTVIAIDKAGNESAEIRIKVITIASLDDSIESITTSNVKSSDKQAIENVQNLVKNLLNSGKTFTSAEQTELNTIEANTENLLKKIDEVQKAMSAENIEKVKNITADNVKAKDKLNLETAKKELYTVLSDYQNNLTEPEKNNINTEIKRIEKALEKINKASDFITSPSTGDNNCVWLWVALLFISALGFIKTAFYEKKKKRN